MNKQQFVEFHKYLAMLIYDYNDVFRNTQIEETRTEVGEILQALEKVQKICIIDKKNK